MTDELVGKDVRVSLLGPNGKPVTQPFISRAISAHHLAHLRTKYVPFVAGRLERDAAELALVIEVVPPRGLHDPGDSFLAAALKDV